MTIMTGSIMIMMEIDLPSCDEATIKLHSFTARQSVVKEGEEVRN